MSHQHATDAPPTHLIRYKIKQRPTRQLTVDQRVGQRVGGIGFFYRIVCLFFKPASLSKIFGIFGNQNK